MTMDYDKMAEVAKAYDQYVRATEDAIIKHREFAIRVWNVLHMVWPQCSIFHMENFDKIMEDREWTPNEIINFSRFDKYFYINSDNDIISFSDILESNCPFTPRQFAEKLMREGRTGIIKLFMMDDVNPLMLEKVEE